MVNHAGKLYCAKYDSFPRACTWCKTWQGVSPDSCLPEEILSPLCLGKYVLVQYIPVKNPNRPKSSASCVCVEKQ